ncbi:YceI family protein [Schumannella sp. 10F1B-5-1]|uniref:YceI family protein n=1 Tax=Schumannella sp. 10F1B-5-1 TaxID=2590780 RepID=UPI001131D63B|nr:YceI family protein [Schumannella sp. 10F1B-5-1]TPW70695.1 YceI family protein [Schumannella sp. 10F1B-5-1]
MTTQTHPSFATGTWKLDPTHSTIDFSVRHLAISKVRGSFETFDVTVVAGETPADLSIEASIDVASVNTNQAQRDEHLRTSDFFLVEEHPTATFRSTSVELDGDDFTAQGDLTLRGVTKPVTLKGELGGVVVDGYGQTKAGFEAKTVINRTDFGVNWNAALEAGGLTLGDDVTLSFEIQLVLQK